MNVNERVAAKQAKLEKQLGELSESDSYWFELLIDSYRKYYQAQEDLSIGRIIKTNQRCYQNPAVTHEDEAKKQIQKLLSYFGIEPKKREQEEAPAVTLDDVLGDEDD